MDSTPAIGIDFGTTYCCVGVCESGKVTIIPNEEGNRTTPSYVAFTETGRLIGEAAKNNLVMNPSNTVFDVRRLIGRRFDHPSIQTGMKNWPFEVVSDAGKPKIQIECKGELKTYFAEDIASMVLTKMKEIAEDYLGKRVINAVIAVPAYFNDSQKQATKHAGTMAGLNVLQIMNQPTAAAKAFGLGKRGSDDHQVIFFDIGGAQTDVSFLSIKDENFIVKYAVGDDRLGGEHFDNRMVNHFVLEFYDKYKKNLSTNKRALRRLRAACEKAKKLLSFNTQASIELDSLFEGIDFYSTITRTHFEKLNTELFNRTIDTFKRAVEELEPDAAKHVLNNIIVIGGSAFIPKVKLILQDFFDRTELNDSINPDEVVAYGAAVQAAVLNGDKSEQVQDMLLFDKTPLSLGIETNGGTMLVMIKRNTPIPVWTRRTLLPSQPHKNVCIRIYEGERAMAKDNNLIMKFYLTGISPDHTGKSKFQITFNINTNGVLSIMTVEQSNGREKVFTISYNKDRLSKELIHKMLKEAQYHEDDDERGRGTGYLP